MSPVKLKGRFEITSSPDGISPLDYSPHGEPWNEHMGRFHEAVECFRFVGDVCKFAEHTIERINVESMASERRL